MPSVFKAHLRPGSHRAGLAWLDANGCAGHCLIVYDNGRTGVVFILDDRTTALMLKLAVG